MDGSAAPDVTLERLHEITDAFARRNVDGIVNSFAEDGIPKRPWATLRSGERQEWLGCDLYTFRRGLIVMKDTYIKVVT